MKHLLCILLAILAGSASAERFGRGRLTQLFGRARATRYEPAPVPMPQFAPPVAQSSPQRVAPQTTPANSQIHPVVNGRERILSIDGVKVPEGATGYRFANGAIEWVYGPNTVPQTAQTAPTAPMAEAPMAETEYPETPGPIPINRTSPNHVFGGNTFQSRPRPVAQPASVETQTTTPAARASLFNQMPRPSLATPATRAAEATQPPTQPQTQTPPPARVEDDGLEFGCYRYNDDPRTYWPKKRDFPRLQKLFPRLGREGMTLEECERSIANGRNGVVCSKTQVTPGSPNRVHSATPRVGWKPTHFSNSVQGRAADGFFGSSMTLEECLLATRFSTPTAVCYWGGSQFHQGAVNGSGQSYGSGGNSIQECLDALNPTWRQYLSGNTVTQTPAGPQPVQRQVATGRTAQSLFNTANPTPATHATTANATPAHLPQSHLDSLPTLGNQWAQNHSTGMCDRCHSTGPGAIASAIPTWALDPISFARALGDPTLQSEARRWFDALYSKIVTEEAMPPLGQAERARFENSPEGQQFKKFLKDTHSALYPNFTSHSSRFVATAAPGRVQILSDEFDRAYRSLTPQIQDQEVAAAFADPNTIFLDDNVMPQGYQDPFGVKGIRDSNNAQFVAGAPFVDHRGKLAVFSTPVGIPTQSSAKTFRFLKLPSGKKIDMWADTAFDTVLWKWKYPVGTMTMEAVYATDSKNQSVVQEIRVRKKVGESEDDWVSDILRPLPTRASLLDALKEIANSKSSESLEAAAVRSQIEAGRLVRTEVSSGPFTAKLGGSGFTQQLPPMSEELVHRLLRRPFQSTQGVRWAQENEQTLSFGPTTNSSFGIVPQYSTHGALQVNRATCNSCHSLSNVPIHSLFVNRTMQSNGRYYNADTLLRNTTDAYGNTPGNDGSFLNLIGKNGNFLDASQGDDRVIPRHFAGIINVRQGRHYPKGTNGIPYRQPQ